jgi:Tectonin domain
MNRRDAIKTIGTLTGTAAFSTLLPGCFHHGEDTEVIAQETDDAGVTQVNPPNFELLNSDNSWPATWTHIVSGKFVSSSYSSLFLYDAASGTGAFSATNGNGAITSPSVAFSRNELGGVNWTHIVPGYFGPSGLMGLFCYDSVSHLAIFIDNIWNGSPTQLCSPFTFGEWTNVVAGYFTPTNPYDEVPIAQTYSGLLTYNQAQNYAYVYTTDGNGNVAQQQVLAAGAGWTHVIAGQFWDNPGDPPNNDQFEGLLMYNSNNGSWQMYYFSLEARVLNPATHDGNDVPDVLSGLPVGATQLLAGNFGGGYRTNVAFFTQSTGQIGFWSFDQSETPNGIWYLPVASEFETQTYPRTTASIVVSGTFHLNDPDDHWFDDGDNTTNEELRNWRASNGNFKDLLFYNSSLGLAETYLHEPELQSPAVLDGYITSTTAHSGGPVSTGSVLAGETIYFHVSAQSQNSQGESLGSFNISVYPATSVGIGTPLYQIQNLKIDTQQIPRGAWYSGAQWPSVGQYTIPASVLSDLYVAYVTTENTSDVLSIPFIVRSSSVVNKILMVISDTTYEAYNDWGGRSLYGYVNALDNAATGVANSPMPPQQQGARVPWGFRVCFDRPHYGRYQTNNAKWTYWEVPFLKWVQQKHIDIDVCTARDLHFDQVPTGYRLLVFVGHEEYWSMQMRENVASFAATGGNIAFLAGNVCWWQVRISTDGTTMTCYKMPGFDTNEIYTVNDPIAGYVASSLCTVNWCAAPVNFSEACLTGASYATSWHPVSATVPFTCQQPLWWGFGATGMTGQATFGTWNEGQDTVVGTEIDNQVLPRGELNTPSNYVEYANVFAPDSDIAGGTMGAYYVKANWVMTVGTIWWSIGLGSEPTVDQVTLNVLTSGVGVLNPASNGSAVDVGVGGNTVWVIGTDNGIYHWNGMSWIAVAGSAARIAVDPSGSPWVVNSEGAIYKWTNGGFYTQLPGAATDIGIGANGAVWILGIDGDLPGGYDIFFWTGTVWQQVNGFGVRIAVDPNGNPWIVNGEGSVYVLEGGLTGTWQEMSIPFVSATDVGVGADGTVWIAGSDSDPSGRQLYQRTGQQWACVSSSGPIAVAVTQDGTPWIVDKSNGIYYWA